MTKHKKADNKINKHIKNQPREASETIFKQHIIINTHKIENTHTTHIHEASTITEQSKTNINAQLNNTKIRA